MQRKLSSIYVGIKLYDYLNLAGKKHGQHLRESTLSLVQERPLVTAVSKDTANTIMSKNPLKWKKFYSKKKLKTTITSPIGSFL